jgi:hypothetical protein
VKTQSKLLLDHYHNQLRIFYWRILLYDLIVESYDRIQHVTIMDLDLVQFYFNITSTLNLQIVKFHRTP